MKKMESLYKKTKVMGYDFSFRKCGLNHFKKISIKAFYKSSFYI